jgi:dolichyl-phosphate-mannose-protein mannosyltransferase
VSVAGSAENQLGGEQRATSRWSAALEGRLAALLVVIAGALYLLPINGSTRDYDEGVYWQSLRAMAAGHPLFTSVFSSQPPMFLLSIYPFYLLFGQSIAAARVGVAVFALVGLMAMYWLAATVAGRWAGLIATSLLLVDPHYLHEAQTLQAEGPALAIEILAVALAVAASRRAGRWRKALAALAGVALAYGTMIKLLDVVAVVPIALYLGAPLLRAFDAGGGRVRRPTRAGLRVGARAAGRDLGLVAAGALGALIIFLAPFAASFGPLWDQTVSFHLAASHTQAWSPLHNLHIMEKAFAWVGLPALVVVGAAYWLRDWRLAPPLLWLAASMLFLVRQVPLFDHHTVIIGPCLALIVAFAPALIGAAFSRAPVRWVALGIAVCVLAVFANSLYLSANITKQANADSPDATQTKLAALNSFSSPGDYVVSDDQYAVALAGRSVPPELVDTSTVRVQSGYLTAVQLERIIARDNVRVILLGTGRLQNIPGFMNWLHANFILEADLGDGAALYVRAPSGSPVA